MNDRKSRITELGKDVLIVLLVISALWLAMRPQLYGRQLSEWLGTVLDQTGYSAVANGQEETDALQITCPARMAAMTEQGRYGTPYDSLGTYTLYSATAGLLNEALSTAEEPAAVSRSVWENALRSAPGVYFEFSAVLPLTALSELLSGGQQAGAPAGTASRLCLAAEGDTVRLFYINEEDGLYYSCVTDVVSRDQLESAISNVAPNGASFAFERGDCANLASYTMLPDTTPAPLVYQASAPMTEEVRTALLEQLGFRSQSNTSYEGPDGMVYLDGGDTLRISDDGIVTYAASGQGEARFPVPAQEETPTDGEMISAAYDLARQLTGLWQGVAELQLTLYERQKDGSVLVELDYGIDGARVIQYDGGSAVSLVIQAGEITDLALRSRAYAPGTETSPLLPVAQAAAAVSALEEDGGELLLCYHDNGGDMVRAGWIVTR